MRCRVSGVWCSDDIVESTNRQDWRYHDHLTLDITTLTPLNLER